MENIDLKIVEVKGITPEILKKMISEFNDPSPEQKAAEEILDKCSYLNEKYASTGLKLKMYFAKDWYEEKEEQLYK